MKRETGVLLLGLLAASCGKVKQDTPEPADSVAGKPSASPTPLPAPSASAPTRYQCDMVATCCSAADAPDSGAPTGVQYACLLWAGDHRRGKDSKSCAESVAVVLELYADPVINTTKAKPPAGCAK